MLISKRHILISFIATTFLGIIYYLLNHYLDAGCWAGMKLSQTVAKHEYCEFSNIDAFFRQKMNSYSNLAYFFFGMIILLSGIDDHRTKNKSNKLTEFPALSIFFGISLMYLCFGSTFFHASLTWPGQRVDMNGTYSVAISLLLIAVYRLLYSADNEKLLKKIIAPLFFLLVLFFIYLHLVISSLYLLPGMILFVAAITIINLLRHKNFKTAYALISICCIVAAFIFRQTDVAKMGCNPYSLWQGHSAWHVLIGLGPSFLYLFYRSEY